MVDSIVLESNSVVAAELLSAVAHPVRWRLLRLLSDGATRCVCQLQPVALVSETLLSYHLKALREAGLVRAERRGTWVDYTISSDALERLRAALPAPPGRRFPRVGAS